MEWTYNKIQRYADCQRRRARRRGCKRCGKFKQKLELAGSPPLARMTRDGYGIERIKEAIAARGWFCRGCARGCVKKERETELGDWGKKKQQQLQLDKGATKEDKLQNECREWMEGARGNPGYGDYLTTLNREECLDGMVEARKKWKCDEEEAFLHTYNRLQDSS
jgi:hypothetical protein